MIGAFKLNTLSKYISYGPPPVYDAVGFDGSGDYYQATSLSNSTVADSKYALIAFTFYWSGGSNLQHPVNLRLGTGSGDYGFWIWINGGRSQLKFVTGNGSNPGSIYENTENSITTNAWNQIVMWIDTTSSTTSQIWLNGNSKAYSNDGFPTGALFNWTNTASTLKIGQKNTSQTGTGADFNGRISQVYISAASSFPGINKFWDSTSGLPQDLGTNGTATGLAQPLIYHYGGTSTFPTNNGTGFSSYTLTANGNVSNAESPTYGTYTPPAETTWSTYSGSADGSSVRPAVPYSGSYRVTGLLAMSDTFALVYSNNFGARQNYTHYPLTISDNAITVGTASTSMTKVNAIGENNQHQMWRLNSTKFANTGYAEFTAYEWNNSTNAITRLGSTDLNSTVGSYNWRNIIPMGDNVALYAGFNSTNTQLHCISFNNSTNAFSFASSNLLASDAGQGQLQKLSDTKAILMTHNATSNLTQIRLITLSGTTISVGSAQTLGDANPYQLTGRFIKTTSSTSSSSNFAAFMTLNTGTSPYTLKVYPVTESGGTMTVGTPITFQAPDATYTTYQFADIFDLNANNKMIRIQWANPSNTTQQKVMSKVITYSGGSITQGSYVERLNSIGLSQGFDSLNSGFSTIGDNRFITFERYYESSTTWKWDIRVGKAN